MRKQDIRPSFPPFTLVRKTYKEGMQPEEYFELFYDEKVINFITSMFNLYASQDKGDASFSTNPEEIKLAGDTDAIGVHVISQMAYDVGVPLQIVLAICI